MTDFHALIHSYQNCACGQAHTCAIRDIEIGSGLVRSVGDILRKNGFGPRLLLAADEQTLAAAEGIEASLAGFAVVRHIWPTIRVATMQDVEKIESYFDRVDGVLAVGTGSVHDPCRLACARHDVPLCLFATAPSMDGFASYSAPIVNGNFKITYPAKCPEVIIGDTKILADAPAALKSAGFGDMISKYVALIDWQVSNLLTGESYCERVAALTRQAADQIFAMAGSVTKRDEKTAAAIFESLLLTGIAMSFTKTSRPGSGTEQWAVRGLLSAWRMRPGGHMAGGGPCVTRQGKPGAFLASVPDGSGIRAAWAAEPERGGQKINEEKRSGKACTAGQCQRFHCQQGHTALPRRQRHHTPAHSEAGGGAAALPGGRRAAVAARHPAG